MAAFPRRERTGGNFHMAEYAGWEYREKGSGIRIPTPVLFFQWLRYESPKYLLPEFLIWCSLVRLFAMK